MSAPAIPSSRRVSAGIVPAPGATARLLTWWSAADWTGLEVPAALAAHPDLLADCHVSAGAVLTVARAMASYADRATGRECRPTNERLVADCRCSLSTVQRARRVLKRLGLVVELIAGRSIMTRAERFTAWERGSSHRRVAATFALCSRSRRAPRRRAANLTEGARSQGACAQHVERDTPPGALGVSTFRQVRRSTPRRRTENEEGGCAARSYRGTRPAGPGGVHPATQRLAQAARARLGWLSGVGWRRLAPTLSRFARAGWTARDVDRAVADALAARGWRRPATLRQPAAYLAALLREHDPADRPGAAEAWRLEVERAENVYRLRLATGTPCPHGVPAGDEPSPLRGLLACPDCRKERR